MEKTINYTLNAEEMTKIHLVFFGLTGRRKRLTVLLLLSMELLAFLCAIAVWIAPGMDSRTIAFGLALTLIVPALLLFQYVYWPRHIRGMYEKQKTLAGEHTLTLTDDYFILKSPFGESRLPWNVFIRWKEEGDYLFLFQNENLTNFVLKSRLDSEALEFIHRKLAENKIPVQSSGRFLVPPPVMVLLVVFALIFFFVWSFLASAFR